MSKSFTCAANQRFSRPFQTSGERGQQSVLQPSEYIFKCVALSGFRGNLTAHSIRKHPTAAANFAIKVRNFAIRGCGVATLKHEKRRSGEKRCDASGLLLLLLIDECDVLLLMNGLLLLLIDEQREE